MPSRIKRILESIKANAGNDIYQRVGETCGEDVKCIVSELERISGAEVVAEVIRPCGRQCIPGSFITRARSIYVEAADIEDFLRLLNETRIGGGKLHIKDDKIIGIYEKCYCSLAKKIKDLSPLFCCCSEGWYEQLFSSVFEKPVGVRRLQTILDGADKCEFEISYQV